jgi:hypothetical protein
MQQNNTAVNTPPASGNKLPVANAGFNQIISLPTDSVLLNGSTSFDSDGWNLKFMVCYYYV